MTDAKDIIIDCDPGQDDAVALLLAVGDPRVNLLGVTTVGGNQSLPKVTRNARAVLEAAHARDVCVHAGSARPLVRRLRVAAEVHGETGLDGARLPEPVRPLDEGHAVAWIIETVMAREPGTVTLVALGPLTNIALAARMEPRIVERVREVVLMGGAVHEGNASPVAEFNIATDPEAAHIVFHEAWPLTMVGLDVTHQALCTPEVQRRIAGLGSDIASHVCGMMDFFRRAYRANRAFPDPPVHDPCAVAYVIDPGVMEVRRCPVDIELAGIVTAGMTVADLRGPEPDARACHTQVGVRLDVERFWNLVVSAIEALG